MGAKGREHFTVAIHYPVIALGENTTGWNSECRTNSSLDALEESSFDASCARRVLTRSFLCSKL